MCSFTSALERIFIFDRSNPSDETDVCIFLFAGEHVVVLELKSPLKSVICAVLYVHRFVSALS